jgi:hypothetical protein
MVASASRSIYLLYNRSTKVQILTQKALRCYRYTLRTRVSILQHTRRGGQLEYLDLSHNEISDDGAVMVLTNSLMC